MWSLSTGIRFCRTIIINTNMQIIIIMCQVNVFILQKGEKFISISECSWLILLVQLKFMTGADFQLLVREKDYCKIQVILNLCWIKFSVPESFETYHFLRQQIMILFSGTLKWSMFQIQLKKWFPESYDVCYVSELRWEVVVVLFLVLVELLTITLNSHFINLNYLCFLTFWWRLFQKTCHA